jgi:hypothetical protein
MIIVFIGLLITTLVLLIGIVLMSISPELSNKYANKLMTLRVLAQAITIFSLMILYYLKS